MKIMFINSFFYPRVLGGAERTLFTLVEGLRERGHEVKVLSLGERAETSGEISPLDYVTELPIRNAYLPSLEIERAKYEKAIWHARDLYNPCYANDVRQHIDEFGPDVVSCHNLSGFSPAVWSVVRASGPPLVQVLHDHYLSCLFSMRSRRGSPCLKRCRSCKFFKAPLKYLSSNVDGLVAISKFMLDSYDDIGYFPNADLKTVIHNAEPEPPRSASVETAEARALTFGFIGTVAPHKGIDLLLETFTSSFPTQDANLRIAGDGPPDYVHGLRSKYTGSNIQFLGPQKKSEFFPTIDYLAVPSISEEPLGRVAFESLSFGIPVIASARGGLPEIIKHGENGFLFDPANTAELSNIFQKVASQKCSFESEKIIASGRYFYDIDRFITQYEHFYERVTSSSNSICS